MNKKTMATTGILAAISVASAVGLLMSSNSTNKSRDMAKKVTCTVEQMSNRMGNMLNCMKK